MRTSIPIALTLVTLVTSCVRSGPGRSTDAGETGPPGSAGSHAGTGETPELLWTYRGLGRGYGAPLISGEGIFINAEEDGQSYTVCLEHDGTFRWKAPNGKEFLGFDFSASYPGTRSAPAIRGQYVYAASGMGHLSCFDARNGDLSWKTDLVEDFQGKPGDFGYSETPAVDEDRVYCFAAGPVHNLVALDRFSGDLAWSVPLMRDSFAYSTPLLLDLPDRDLLVGSSRNYIYAVDRKDGKLLSSYRLEDITYGWEHCNSVSYREGYLYFVTCEEHGQGTIKLRLSGDGETLTEIWRNPEVKNVFEGFVVKDGWLYTTMENKKLLCLDTENGRIRHSLRAEFGNMVPHGNLLIVYGHNGILQIFQLKDGIPEPAAQWRIRTGSGPHFSFPVISDGILYLRRGDALMAWAL
jgi:outer membrane protein assembly factor BamB